MTGHVNDHKLAALQSLLSISGGNIDDLEQAWLITEASSFGHVNDMWLNVFQVGGATSLNYSDAAYEFLSAAGHSGGINQMWHDYWEAGGGVPIAVVVHDTFTEAIATLITAHSPDIDLSGGGYSNNIIAGAEPSIAGGSGVVDTSQGSSNETYIETRRSDVVVTVTGRGYHATNSFTLGLIARFSDLNNYWLLHCDGTTSVAELYEKNGGTFTLRDSTAFTWVNQTDYALSLTTSGTAISAQIDGGNDLSYISSLHQSATICGMRNANSARMDEFKVTG